MRNQNEQEIFKSIPGYELYQASNLGNIRSINYNNMGIPKNIIPFLSKGYQKVVLSKNGKRKSFLVHQLVAMAFLEHIPDMNNLVLDHINCIKSDNRVENLRIVTSRENNSKPHERNKSSKYTGVCWFKCKSKWKSTIKIGKKAIHLGYFTNEEEASQAYQTALKQLVLA